MDGLTPALQASSILAIALAAGQCNCHKKSLIGVMTIILGTNISTTIVTLPALLHAPAGTLATQWKTLFSKGTPPVVSLTLSSSVGFAALAYRHPANATGTLTRNLYIAASLAAFGLIPYTRLLMWDNITSLATEGQQQQDTHDLVKTWGKYNLWRGIMLLSSAGFGLWASLI